MNTRRVRSVLTLSSLIFAICPSNSFMSLESFLVFWFFTPCASFKCRDKDSNDCKLDLAHCKHAHMHTLKYTARTWTHVRYKQRAIQYVQLKRHGNFRFIIICTSYSVKSHYFDIILNLLRLLEFKIKTMIAFIIQLLSIIIEERRGDGRAE